LSTELVDNWQNDTQEVTVMSLQSSARLNDVNLESVGGLVAAIQNDPNAAATTWSASVRWTGGFRSEAQVREFVPLSSDEPTGLGGTDSAPNPVEQLLASLGNCLAVGYAANASVAGIMLNDVRIELTGDVDLHTFLGLRDGHAGFDGIRISVHIDSDAPTEALEALHTKVIGSSPVGHTLSHAVELEYELVN
jgi:uncharacterized OsmC-like protein